jgi:hypothetical protein
MRRNFHKSLPQRERARGDINGARRPAADAEEREKMCESQLPAAAAQVDACERTRTALNRDAIITATQVPFNSCIYYERGDECVSLAPRATHFSRRH